MASRPENNLIQEAEASLQSCNYQGFDEFHLKM
jgi:hypothetical protein